MYVCVYMLFTIKSVGHDTSESEPTISLLKRAYWHF